MSELLPPPALTLHGVTAGYGGDPVLRDLELALPAGRLIGILGPNGCGKSTLLRVCCRLLVPDAGSVRLGGTPLDALRRGRELARRIAMLPQNPVAPVGMTVLDLVARGRQPHQPWCRQWGPGDERAVADAMADTQVGELADRPLDELSGGQRQRAWLAMALAQQTDVVLLDEPIAHLDPAHAVEVLEVLVRLRRDAGKTIAVVLHDLNLAARFTDHLVVMRSGSVQATGTPEEVLGAHLLADVFGLDARVFPDPEWNRPVIVPASHA